MPKVTKGRFVWYDLMTTDAEAAKPFYHDVVGWGAAPWDGGEKPYTMWMNGETPLGGVMELPEEARRAGSPPHWLAYIASPDVGDTVTRASQLGGQVIMPVTDIPQVGKFAVLSDPQGAMFAVYTPDADEPESGAPTRGQISWHELATTDYDAAFGFYRDLFGWEITDDADMGPIGVYRMYGQQGIPYGGMYNLPADMPAPPHWLLYTQVDDINDAVARVKEKGGQVLNGPMEVPGGDMIAQCMDPQGAAFALHEVKGQ
jgi:uncharacterized protein